MAKENKRTTRVNRYNYSLQSIIPLILIVAIIPIIVRLKVVPLSKAINMLNYGQDVNWDFFSYYKMVYFLAFTSIGGLVFIYKYLYKKDTIIKKTNIYYPMIAYVAFIMLSTIFATYKDVAILGFSDRYEGMFVLIGYMICLFLSINLIDDEKQVKYLLFALGSSVILISIIGIFQFLGKDLFATTFGRKLIVPNEYIHIIDKLRFEFGGIKTIYGTLFNTNYVGVYMSMIFPLSCTILFLSKERIIKIFSGIVAILSFINLLGSGSRAGMISVILYALLLIIFFRGLIFSKWKLGVTAIVTLGIVLFGVNYYSKGFLKARVLLVKDSITKVESSDLKDLILEDNEARIIIEDYEIRIIYEGNNLTFKDKDNNIIESVQEKNKITFNQEPYNRHFIEGANHDGNLALQLRLLTNKGWIKPNLVINSEGKFKFLTPNLDVIDLPNPPHWGFEGREGFASGRGYIWSRSIPLLKDTIILGHGPDTYALHFPQDDYLGKLQSGTFINLIVDKPHNLYLQTAINTGVASLISIIILFAIYIISSITVYINKKEYNSFLEIAGIGIFFAICGYLMVGFLNDSVISVAPVFWILLGIGISINMKFKTE